MGERAWRRARPPCFLLGGFSRGLGRDRNPGEIPGPNEGRTPSPGKGGRDPHPSPPELDTLQFSLVQRRVISSACVEFSGDVWKTRLLPTVVSRKSIALLRLAPTRRLANRPFRRPSGALCLSIAWHDAALGWRAPEGGNRPAATRSRMPETTKRWSGVFGQTPRVVARPKSACCRKKRPRQCRNVWAPRNP